VVIRAARPAEYEEVGRVIVRAYREFSRDDDGWRSYERALGDVGARAAVALVLVAVEGYRVLGTATLETGRRIEPEDDPPLAPHEAHVRMVGVDPTARGRGIGRMLMEACIREARALGKTLITLHTTPWMKAAQRMYESMGFERKHDKDRRFESGLVLLTYWLPLKARDATP
jgi:ribosomal protein S18 acetylase RimI-like enzyme